MKVTSLLALSACQPVSPKDSQVSVLDREDDNVLQLNVLF